MTAVSMKRRAARRSTAPDPTTDRLMDLDGEEDKQRLEGAGSGSHIGGGGGGGGGSKKMRVKRDAPAVKLTRGRQRQDKQRQKQGEEGGGKGRSRRKGEQQEEVSWQALFWWQASACAVCGAGCVVWWTFVMGEVRSRGSGKR